MNSNFPFSSETALALRSAAKLPAWTPLAASALGVLTLLLFALFAFVLILGASTELTGKKPVEATTIVLFVLLAFLCAGTLSGGICLLTAARALRRLNAAAHNHDRKT